jgi:hypothetical protein
MPDESEQRDRMPADVKGHQSSACGTSGVPASAARGAPDLLGQ